MKMKKISQNTCKGFTLIELMITIVIAGILLAMGIPSFNQMIKNNQLTTQVNLLVTSLNLARNEAIKRSVNITICQSSTGNSCVGNWPASNNGWIVFVDTDNDGIADVSEEILRVHGKLDGGNTLKYSRNRVSYSSQGYATGFNGTFVLCDSRGNSNAKAEVVSNTGRARKSIDGADADTIVEDGSGNNITCP
jgi:type IV fimbrial biogenesis protein FimT